MDPKEVAAALGIAEDGDPVAAIQNMQTQVAELRAQITSDPKTAASAELVTLRNSLTQANQKVLAMESEFNNKLAVLNENRRQEQAKAKVEMLVTRGKILPAMKETALDLALNLTPEKFDAYVATIKNVDLTERGVASGDELAELEPTGAEVASAKTMGIDTTSKEWRLGIMRQHAKAKGLTLPAEVA
jgi:hypothetical protein